MVIADHNTNLIDCNYAERSKKRRRKVATVEQMKVLEDRLKTMEHYMTMALPTITGANQDINRLNLNHPSPSSAFRAAQTPDTRPLEEVPGKAKTRHGLEHSEIGFHGISSELAFLGSMRDKLGDGIEVGKTFRSKANQNNMPRLFDPAPTLDDHACLPSRARAQELIDVGLDAFPLMYILHRPTFDKRLDLIYTLDPKDYTLEDSRFLPLLYSVMALGRLFTNLTGYSNGKEQAKIEGFAPIHYLYPQLY
jgi:hypothetical protein